MTAPRSRSWQSTVLALCALAMTAASLLRMATNTSSSASSRDEKLDRSFWQEITEARFPEETAGRVSRLLVFADFECPACGAFHRRLQQLDSALPGAFTVSHARYPLEYHPFAERAAIAFECASQQHVGSVMQHLLYENQASFGLRSLEEFALLAGVRDSAAFTSCASSPEVAARIAADVELGRRVGVDRTPTIVFEGTKLGTIPTAKELEQLIAAHRGRSR